MCEKGVTEQYSSSIEKTQFAALTIDFGHDVLDDVLVHLDHAVLGDRRVREDVDLGAGSSHPRERVASTADVAHRRLVDGDFAAAIVVAVVPRDLALRVDMGAESVRALRRARDVRHARVVGDVPDVLDELVRRGVPPSVARPGVVGAAVQNELDGQVDVVTLPEPCDFDPVGQRRQGAVRPA